MAFEPLPGAFWSQGGVPSADPPASVTFRSVACHGPHPTARGQLGDRRFEWEANHKS